MKRGAGDGTRKNKAFFTSTNAAATATCVAGMRLGLECCPGALNKQLGAEGIAGVQETIERLGPSAIDNQGRQPVLPPLD
jgi:hypothetical protein